MRTRIWAKGRSGSVAILLGLVVTLGPVVFVASAHSGCTVTQSGGWDIWDGDEHANICNAGDGKDSMFGFGAGDDFGGGQGRDNIRGATGGDLLTDFAGGGDIDKTCDGNGLDEINLKDGDGNDKAWMVLDSFNDIVKLNGGDTSDAYSPNNCPLSN